MERLEAKLAAMGDRKSVDELINQTMALHTELKQKSQMMIKLEEKHSAETNEFKVMTDEMTAQLITLKEALEKAETEKTVMEASMVRMAETSIKDALDMNISLVACRRA